MYCTTVWREILAGQNFCVFHRLVSDHENFNHSQCKPQPFLTVGVAYFRSVIIESLTSVCAMAMYHSVDKLPKLPDSTGSLSMKVSSSSNVLANAGGDHCLLSQRMESGVDAECYWNTRT